MPKKIESKCKHCGSVKTQWSHKKTEFCSYQCWADYNKQQYITEWLDGKNNGSYPSGMLDKRIKAYFKEHMSNCESCGLGKEWQGKPLTLEIDHIDGNRKNNIKKNLRYLCPNCHSQTPTFRRYGG